MSSMAVALQGLPEKSAKTAMPDVPERHYFPLRINVGAPEFSVTHKSTDGNVSLTACVFTVDVCVRSTIQVRTAEAERVASAWIAVLQRIFEFNSAAAIDGVEVFRSP